MRALPIALLFLVACGSSPPETNYYQLEAPEAREASGDAPVLMIEPLTSDGAYDDTRIVYRESPYQLGYYHYHRWSASPDRLISDYLRNAYAASGQFSSVVSEPVGNRDLILSGRVVALEEVDRTERDWLAHVTLDLRLRNADTGEILWSRTLRERVPLTDRSPAGLARGISVALGQIVQRTAPQFAAIARRQQDLRAEK